MVWIAWHFVSRFVLVEDERNECVHLNVYAYYVLHQSVAFFSGVLHAEVSITFIKPLCELMKSSAKTFFFLRILKADQWISFPSLVICTRHPAPKVKVYSQLNIFWIFFSLTAEARKWRIEPISYHLEYLQYLRFNIV